jgi:hypothetical protein
MPLDRKLGRFPTYIRGFLDGYLHNGCVACQTIFAHRTTSPMSDHHFEGHFPEEAEQNEIGGPVLVALMVLATVVLLIWAAS